MERITAHGLSNEARVTRLHFDGGPFMLVGIEIDVLAFAHQPMERSRKFGKPLDALDAAELAGLILGPLVPFPEFNFSARFAKKQNLTLLFVVSVGKQKQDGLFLLDAGKMKQVGVGRHCQGAIRVGGRDVIGIDGRE